MDTITARLILGADPNAKAETLRSLFEARRDRIEIEIATATDPATKDAHRTALARMVEAYAALGGGAAPVAPAPVAAPPLVPVAAAPVAAAPVAAAPSPAVAAVAPAPVSITTPAGSGRLVTIVLVLLIAGGAGAWWLITVQRAAKAQELMLSEIAAVEAMAAPAVTAALDTKVRAYAADASASRRATVEAAWTAKQKAITEARLLVEIAAVEALAPPAVTAALDARVRAFAAGTDAAGRAAVEAAWTTKQKTVAEAHQRRRDEIGRLFDASEARLRLIAADADAAQAQLALLPAAESATGERAAYLTVQRRLKSDFATWLRQAADGHPARGAVIAGRAALAGGDYAAASAAAAKAESELAERAGALASSRPQRVELPLLRHCAERLAAGQVDVVSWYRADGDAAAAVRLLGERLAVLDRSAPIPPTAASEVALYAALGGEPAKGAAWQAKLTKSADLTRRLAGLNEDLDPGAWMAFEQPLAELVGLVGSDEEPMRGWRAKLEGFRNRLEAARKALVVLEKPPATLSDEQAMALDQAQRDLEELLPPGDDTQRDSRRGILDPLAAVARRRAALATTDVKEHHRLMLAAARGGDVEAGGRLVLLARWNDMGTFDPRSGPTAAWAESSTVRNGLSDRQVFGEFLANWATRHRQDDIDVNAEMLRGRELINGEPIEHHPVLLSEAGWLSADVEPKDADLAHSQRQASAEATEAFATKLDPLAAQSVLETGANAAVEAEAPVLARRLFVGAATVAQTAGRQKEAAWDLLAAARQKDPEAEEKADLDARSALVAKARERYRTLVAEAEARHDDKGRADALFDLATSQRPTQDPRGSWERAAAAYGVAAAAYVQARLPYAEATCISNQAECWSPAYNQAGSWQRAGELYAQAAARHASAGNRVSAARCLAEQAYCVKSQTGLDGALLAAAELYGKAAQLASEAGARRLQMGYLRDQGRCYLDSSTAGKPSSWGKAAEAYAQAAMVAKAEGAAELLVHCLHQQGYCLDTDQNPSGDQERSVGYYQQAIEASTAAKLPAKGLATTYYNLGYQLVPVEGRSFKGSWEKARDAFAEAAKLYTELDQKVDAATAYYQEGRCSLPDRAPNGSYPRARELAERAIPVLRTAPQERDTLACALELRGVALQVSLNPAGSWSEAIAAHAEAAKLFADLGNRSRSGSNLKEQACCLMPNRNSSGGSWDEAAKLFAEAADRLRGDTRGDEAFCLHQQAVCLVRADAKNMTDEARALFRRAAALDRALGKEAQAKISEDWIK